MRFEFGSQTINISPATRAALDAEVAQRFQTREGFALATVNLDHLVKLSASSDFARAYAAQDLVVADGRPIVWLSRLAGQPVELMPGSDLVVPLCRLAARERVKVALVGSTEQALADAKASLEKTVPGLEVALCHAPSGKFDPFGAEADAILARLRQENISLCFLALGAPKQEILAHRGRTASPATGFASVGAGLDFLGGHQVRAPRWVRAIAFEWLWRAMSSPGRLLPRYARCFAILPSHALRALRQRRASGVSPQ